MTVDQAQTPREIQIYDTLSRTKRVFEPLVPGEVSMYVCGITVYDLTHIGHARTFIFFDTVQRYLRHIGYQVKFVRNHTDVDDKIIKRANERGEEPLALAQHFIDELDTDMGALGVQSPDLEPRVSTHIDEIIDMVQALIDRGYGYEANGDVYYRVRSFEGYGKLSGRKLEDMEAGRSGRVTTDDSGKEHPFDFALWKASKEGEPAWASPWGPGRPGWHIECSAMSRAHLGDSFDIHGGGQDLTFPHHENEIAQSEACTGHAPMARTWMHVAMLNVDGEKMSKSLGNFWTTREVLAAYHPEVIRYFMHQAHYRSPINYSTGALNEATRAVYYLYGTLANITDRLKRGGLAPGDDAPDAGLLDAYRERVERFTGLFEEALADDFNTARAISYLYDLAKAANEMCAGKKKPKAPELATLLAIWTKLDEAGELLGLMREEPHEAQLHLRDLMARALEIDAEVVDEKIAARDAARQSKDWAAADALRDELHAMHVELLDTPEGTSWRVKFDEID